MKHKKHKKHSRSSSSSDINIKKGLADVGRMGSNVGVVVAWILLVFLSIGGIVMIGYAFTGHAISNGSCSTSVDGDPPDDKCLKFSKSDCTKPCKWTTDEVTNLSTGTTIGLIVGGLCVIGVGVGILFLARYQKKYVRKHKGAAAVVGGMFMADAILGRR